MIPNEDINEALLDGEYKDESPIKTVEKIKGILRDNGIETTEELYDSEVPYCSSLRVTVNGTAFGSNGKGLSPEFTLASGYGELVERLQIGCSLKKGGSGLEISEKVTISLF